MRAEMQFAMALATIQDRRRIGGIANLAVMLKLDRRLAVHGPRRVRKKKMKRLLMTTALFSLVQAMGLA